MAFRHNSPGCGALPWDLRRLGSGERNAAKPQAREGRASGSERVKNVPENNLPLLHRMEERAGVRMSYGSRVDTLSCNAMFVRFV